MDDMVFFSAIELRFILGGRHMIVIQLYNLPFCCLNFKRTGIINAGSLKQFSLQVSGAQQPMEVFDDRLL